MVSQQFDYSSKLPVSAEDAYAWHDRWGAFQRLTPPWEPVSLERNPQRVLVEGSEVVLALKPLPGVSLRWHATHSDIIPGQQFCDTQTKGPFTHWRHCHRFETIADTPTSQLTDSITYTPPLGKVGAFFGGPIISQKLERMFRYRHVITQLDLWRHQHAASQGLKPQRILISGSSGLLGEALCAFLSTGGHQVYRLLRPASTNWPGFSESQTLAWQPERQVAPPVEQLEGFDAVIHLNGANVAGGRWSDSYRKQIWQSRIATTRLLVDRLLQTSQPPKVFFCASGIGAYPANTLTSCEESIPINQGSGIKQFMGQLSSAWEAEAARMQENGQTVTTLLRTSLVLSPKGGMLGKLWPAFSTGICPYWGQPGSQLAWIALDDVLGALLHLLTLAQEDASKVAGPVNLVSPRSLTIYDFAKTLSRITSGFPVFPLPDTLMRLYDADFTDNVLQHLPSVQPKRLLATGYRFAYPSLEGALRHCLGLYSPANHWASLLP